MISFNEFLCKKFKEAKLISTKEVNLVLERCNKEDITFIDALIEESSITKDKIYSFIAKLMSLEYISLSITDIDLSLINTDNSPFFLSNRIIPFKKDNDLILCAIDNPFKINEYAFIANYFENFQLKLISSENMEEIITRVSNKERRVQAQEALKEEGKKEEVTKEHDLDEYISAPAVAFANTLLEEAVSLGASDIHMEPSELKVKVRFRIDGVLVEHCEIEPNMYQAVLTRYKIISGLDIAERRIPQDGKITLKINDNDYDFRISTLPLIHGEKIVIRIYNVSEAFLSIEKMCQNKKDALLLSNMIKRPHGIILLTGPTGSGKTTTLYTFLKELNNPGVNIQTVEDPVENQILGVNQLQVNTKTGLTFATALRSILRQDPNIIMVGEIRDEETAHIAIQAAITGHLVLSTIHTNDAVTTIVRLIDMGVEPYLISDALSGAVSQRLVRKLCPHCKKPHKITKSESMMTGISEGKTIYEPVGCSHCNHIGYKGRTAVLEILNIGKNLRSSMENKEFSLEKLNDAAKKDGIVFLKKKAADLVESGITSIEEFSNLITQDLK